MPLSNARSTVQPDLGVDLTDERIFAANAFWPVLVHLRATAPVYRHPEPDGPGFWVLTRHEDIVEVYAHHERFSSRYGMRIGTDPLAVSAAAERMLIVSDPPQHTYLKQVLGRPFGPGELPRIETIVRRVVGECFDDVVTGEILDFANAARRIPNHVVCTLLGVPQADWAWLGSTTTDAFDATDPARRTAAHGELFLYFTEALEERRRFPRDDYISRIAQQRVGTETAPVTRALTDEEIVVNCTGVLSGANETTRYAMLGGLLALGERTDQWKRLRAGRHEAVAGTVEEILRWTSPGIHSMRTATGPATIHDVPIAPGDRVSLWNASANRDEDVFTRATEFDITRAPNRHLTFGHGRHVCIGARLARLELAAFVEQLVTRVAAIDLAGVPRYNSSNFTWGVRSLPVRLVPSRNADSGRYAP